MKIVAYIMSILIVGLTAKPMMHHYAHEHQLAHMESLNCCSNIGHSETNTTLEGHFNQLNSKANQHSSIDHHKHDSSTDSCCSENCSSCSSKDDTSNCGDEGHQCDGQCHCAFSVSSSFSVEPTEKITVAEFKIERKFIFVSEYHLDIPAIIWHPPQLV